MFKIPFSYLLNDLKSQINKYNKYSWIKTKCLQTLTHYYFQTFQTIFELLSLKLKGLFPPYLYLCILNSVDRSNRLIQ